MHQAIEIGSEKKGGEAGLEDPWESRGSKGFSGSVLGTREGEQADGVRALFRV